MRKERIKKNGKTVCTDCGGCSFEVWTKDREILKSTTIKMTSSK